MYTLVSSFNRKLTFFPLASSNDRKLTNVPSPGLVFFFFYQVTNVQYFCCFVLSMAVKGLGVQFISVVSSRGLSLSPASNYRQFTSSPNFLFLNPKNPWPGVLVPGAGSAHQLLGPLITIVDMMQLRPGSPCQHLTNAENTFRPQQGPARKSTLVK